MNEEWRAIPGLEGYYEASSAGRIRSVSRAWKNSEKIRPGRTLAARPSRSGHMRVQICVDGSETTWLVHRLVLLAFVGAPPAGTEGCHNNGDPADNRIENLRWDTHAANARDALSHGTHENARKKQCPSGHDYTPQNTYYNAGRKCRTCNRLRASENKAKASGVDIKIRRLA
ncbi:NUMOD4 motif-containing HNH endonuclease [Leifsonia sp. Root227]|uniref:NUMOD4 motif-containing HNH endonuclease n=1 Tax=Leifsonia sp. Root227 TaxID=1736496 RepID=UPI0009E8EBAE|nr:NUMOD4 motif-containing HNH endonuclease [Leifsonia sp. Root227]